VRDTPSVSVVVPVRNRSGELEQCLGALGVQSGDFIELIVVDDASTEDCAGVAVRFGADVRRMPRQSGAAAARNHGAGLARGDLLLFVDADVVVQPDTVRRTAALFALRPELDALFGSYDARPEAESVVSQFRNLLHHFTHQIGNRAASTFWAGCGAVRRDRFVELGGFDGAWEAIEDIELGYRLHARGGAILLEPTLQVKHLKRWTLGSMIRTDLLGRAIPWSRLIAARRFAPDDLNVRTGQKLSVALAFVIVLAAVASTVQVSMLFLAATAWAGLLILNRDFYSFLRRTRGFWFVAACMPLHVVYFVTAGLGFAWARVERVFARDVSTTLSRTAS
jgi:glycosyltransferase involved in cell wall biosynthesis